MWHLYEVVISNSRGWLKVQASCSSSEQSAAFFEYRFSGTDYTTVDGHRPVTPFRLSQRSHYVANWASIVDRLPEGWDGGEFHIVGTPYPWCGTLSDDCDCHGAKGRLDLAYCSDFGLHDETDKRASKSQNVRHLNYIQTMAEIATEAIEPPDDDHVSLPRRLEEGGEPRAVLTLSGRLVLVDRVVADAVLAQSIPLQVEALGTVRLRYPRVADQHWRLQNDRFCDP